MYKFTRFSIASLALNSRKHGHAQPASKPYDPVLLVLKLYAKSVKTILRYSLLIMSANSYSQQQKYEISNMTRATFFAPGISFEKAIGNFQSLCARAFLSTSVYIGYSSAMGNTSSIHSYPALSLQYRYYYNSGHREAKGRRTEMNSLNYVCALTEAAFYETTVSSDGDKDIRGLNTFGIAWGLSRNYQRRFSLDLCIGLGYVLTKKTTENDLGQFITEHVAEITNVGEIGLGFWLNKRK
jgi:hypothetical protein